MLSNSSICSTCDKKRVCKHFDYASKNVDLTINIEQCEHNVPVLKKTDINSTPIKPSTPVPTPWTPYDPNNPYKATSRVYGLYPDLNKSDVAGSLSHNGKPPLKVTPIEVPNGTCSICGKTAIVDNCSDCGEPICSECGYTNIDVNEKKPIITCDKCFGSHDDSSKESINTEWDISNFSEMKEEQEENKDVKSRNKKTGSKGSSKNTKKS